VSHQTLAGGVYQHVKGNFYLVLGTARDDRDESLMVVYVRLYEREGDSPPMSVRAFEQFLEEVDWPDGSRKPRFCWYGPAPTVPA
jgi:hypothetical protein